MRSHRILPFFLTVALLVQPGVALAQSADDFPGASKWRRWALAAGGAVLLGSVATLTDQAGEQARRHVRMQ